MSSEQNKAIARRIPVEVFSQGRLEVVDEILAPDFTEHIALPPGVPGGREGLKAVASALRKGFPDITYRVDLQIAEGDFVAAYVTVSGTHKGEVFGMPANGKITEHWGVVDQLGMLRQLGLAPASEPVLAGRSS